jgi:hypothetical protein
MRRVKDASAASLHPFIYLALVSAPESTENKLVAR